MMAQRERDLRDALDALLKHFKRHTQHRCEIVTEAESVLSGHQLPRFEVPDDLAPDAPVSDEGREVTRLRAALQCIKDNEGKVCAEFEVCHHVACQSSVSAWMIADAALRGERWEPPEPSV